MSSRFQVLREEDEVSGNEELEIVGASKKVESGVGKARAHGLTTTVQHKVAVKKHGNSPKDNTQILEVQDKGLASSTFRRHFKDFMRIHHPELVALMEPRVSGRKADNILQRLGFVNSFRIKAHGLVKGYGYYVMTLFKLRDRNTKFYHAFASSQHCANKVAGFRKDNREWCTNPGHLHVLASGFYKLLFTSSGADSSSYPIHGHFPSVEA
ncbi:hypothetical protein V6N11_012689 [Hibiscus sabdariffa]|uniref:Uncharacterized protein n=1 Tax=Hibiscus sabdariffa TaxID=183260 RepID=A0ABR2QBW2_9ROSI